MLLRIPREGGEVSFFLCRQKSLAVRSLVPARRGLSERQLWSCQEKPSTGMHWDVPQPSLPARQGMGTLGNPRGFIFPVKGSGARHLGHGTVPLGCHSCHIMSHHATLEMSPAAPCLSPAPLSAQPVVQILLLLSDMSQPVLLE